MKKSQSLLALNWRMLAGFSGLLFLIGVIGLIGMWQINDLTGVINRLGRIHMPVQNAVLSMRSSNSQYAMGIRSYVFWKSTRYKDAVRIDEKLVLANAASREFDKSLSFYQSNVTESLQDQWINILRNREIELRSLGDNIIDVANQIDVASRGGRVALEKKAIELMMEFESRLFRIDAYLNDPIQNFNVTQINQQIEIAESGRSRSLMLLFWSLIVALALGAQLAYLIYRRSVRDKFEREELWRRVVGVEEEERNNLALQVHDQMGQDLSALKIYLGLIDKEISRGEQKERVTKAKNILDNLMKKTHNISELLRPPELDELGLSESVEALILQHRQMTDVEYSYVKPEAELKLSFEHKLLLYRAVQEALTNAVKYSKAKHIRVVFLPSDKQVSLVVADDGVGFDAKVLFVKPHRRSADKMRLGLWGIKERVEVFNGALEIESIVGKGTTLKVTLPLS